MCVHSVKLRCVAWEIDDDRRHSYPVRIVRVSIYSSKTNAAGQYCTDEMFSCQCYDREWLQRGGGRRELPSWYGLDTLREDNVGNFSDCLFSSIDEILAVLVDERRAAVKTYEFDNGPTAGG